MSKIIAIMTNEVEDIEYDSPHETLKAAGHSVDLVENEAHVTIHGKHGSEYMTDRSIDEVSVDQYDALLIPGGFSPDQLRADERYVSFH